MTAVHDLELMQHADGELDERTAADVDAAILRDPAAADKRAALGEVGELVRGHLEMSADDVADDKFAAMWREIDKSVENERAAPAIVVAPPKPALAGRVSRWFERFRSHIITGALSAGVVAALAIVLRPAATEDHSTGSNTGPIEVRPVGQRAPAIIESLDVPNGTGNVINVHDDEGNTTVIWVTPADIVEGT